MSIAGAREHLRLAERKVIELRAYVSSGPYEELAVVHEAIRHARLELDGPLLSEAIPVTVAERERAKATTSP